VLISIVAHVVLHSLQETEDRILRFLWVLNRSDRRAQTSLL
jgi:hypothetical protein